LEAQIGKLLEQAYREKTRKLNELNNFGKTHTPKVEEVKKADQVKIKVTSNKSSANEVQRAAKRSKMDFLSGVGMPIIPAPGARVKISEEVARALKEDLQKFLNIPVVCVQNITVNNFNGQMADN
jgi:hypothetical protein